MEDMFSYWPLIFFVLIAVSRLIRYFNKNKKQAAKNNEENIDNIKEVTKQGKSTEPNQQKEQYDTFSYDSNGELETITDQKTEEFRQREQKAENEEKVIKKPHVKKLKGGKKVKLFTNKKDIIRGIVMKEVLDQPRYKKKSRN